jgi:hypothetical protein
VIDARHALWALHPAGDIPIVVTDQDRVSHTTEFTAKRHARVQPHDETRPIPSAS